VVTLGEGCTSVDAPSRGAHAGLEQRWGFHNDDTDHSAGVAIGQAEVRHLSVAPEVSPIWNFGNSHPIGDIEKLEAEFSGA
jgi:hypothetical protein